MNWIRKCTLEALLVRMFHRNNAFHTEIMIFKLPYSVLKHSINRNNTAILAILQQNIICSSISDILISHVNKPYVFLIALHCDVFLCFPINMLGQITEYPFFPLMKNLKANHLLHHYIFYVCLLLKGTLPTMSIEKWHSLIYTESIPLKLVKPHKKDRGRQGETDLI